MCFFFFFQAEAGIRAYDVTGIQTCALPIFSRTSYEKGIESVEHAFDQPFLTSREIERDELVGLYTASLQETILLL